MRKPRLSRVIRWFGTWAVTAHGLEHTEFPAYTIDKKALAPRSAGVHDWPEHMAEKGWVCMHDFTRALDFARTHFHPHPSPYIDY